MALFKTGWLRSAFWRGWYPLFSRLIADSQVAFLNYGYVDLDPQAVHLNLEAQDEADRLSIQLYQNAVAGLDLHGLEVLEVSSGHGGGASYLARYAGPKSMTGVDLNPAAVAACARRHAGIPGLSFRQGNAESLPFEDGSFDALLNVEASHCYASMPRFLAEVRRLLRPGGCFLFTDFRDRDQQDGLLQDLQGSGLEILQAADITPNVLAAMELDEERKRGLIERHTPGWLRTWVNQFAGMEGSQIFEGFRSGRKVYLHYVLRKSDPQAAL